MIFCNKFGYKPAIKNLDNVEEITEGKIYKKVQTAFIQVEEHDKTT